MIYFARLPTGSIKIGYSENVEARMVQLAKHYGCDLQVLRTEPGGMEEERVLHARFSHLRFGRTEQFQPGPDLLASIGQPSVVGHDAVEAMEPVPKPWADLPFQVATVKVDKSVAFMAKFIATDRGVSVAEVLSDMLAGPVEQAFVNLVAEIGPPVSG